MFSNTSTPYITLGDRRYYTRLIFSITVLTLILAVASSVVWLIGVGAGPVSSQHLVIIDTDPGVDDAVALMVTLGAKNLNVLAVTAVRGNTVAANVAINALKILRVAGYNKIPVYSGHDYGLIDTASVDGWFGTDGLGDLPFPNPPTSHDIQAEHAASFLARTVQQYPGQVTIICLGPLTNIALALHLNPQFLNQAKRVIILGGSIRGQGNAAPGVEFNFFMDPHAAALVLDRASASNVTLTMMPLETVTDNHISKEWRWNTMAKVNNSVVSWLNQLDSRLEQMHPSPVYTPFDAYAAVVAFSPDLVTHSQDVYGFVENEGKRSQGALMVDYNHIMGKPFNLEIIMEVNLMALEAAILDNLSNFR